MGNLYDDRNRRGQGSGQQTVTTPTPPQATTSPAASGYQSSLKPQDYSTYQRLNQAYRAAFGAGNFGDFDYNAFLNDPKYAQNIYDTIMASPSGDQDRTALKAKALDDLLKFFEQQQGGNGFEPIDVKGIFDPYASAAKSAVSEDINRGARGATERATEALAGTGLGRSGVAAQTFTGIENKRQELLAKANSNIELETMRREAELEYQEKLLERNWGQEQIRDALQFDRQLMMMSFEAAAQYDPGSWMDTWGDVIGTAAGIAIAL